MGLVKFALLIQPLDTKEIFPRLPFMRVLPPPLIEVLARNMPPLKLSPITGITTAYARTEGIFISLGLTPEQMLTLPPSYCYRKVIKSGRKAQKLGASIIGLGSVISELGDGGVSIAQNLKVAVTTGSSYKVAVALEGIQRAAELMDLKLENAQCLILGATSSLGFVCSRLMARKGVGYLTLVTHDKGGVEKLAEKILDEAGISVKVTSNLKKALDTANIVINASKIDDSVVEPDFFLPGTVICDLASSRGFFQKVTVCRDDVLFLEGGYVDVPGSVEFNLNFGLPPGSVYPCMAEPMILALEGRIQRFSLGREIRVEKIEEIEKLARKHGFKLGGLHRFEHAIIMEEVNRVKQNALQKTQNPLS